MTTLPQVLPPVNGRAGGRTATVIRVELDGEPTDLPGRRPADDEFPLDPEPLGDGEFRLDPDPVSPPPAKLTEAERRAVVACAHALGRSRREPFYLHVETGGSGYPARVQYDRLAAHDPQVDTPDTTLVDEFVIFDPFGPPPAEPVRQWEHPELSCGGVYMVARLGETFGLLRRLRRSIRRLDTGVLPAVMSEDMAAVDAAMSRLLLIARHGVYRTDVPRDRCDEVSNALDADESLDNCRV